VVSTTRTRIIATGIAGALALAPAAGAGPSSVELQGPAVKGAAGGTSHQPVVPATRPEPATPVVVRSNDAGVDVGSAALGAGGAALVLLASGAGVASARRARVRHGLS
jgi:hypothetical protein